MGIIRLQELQTEAEASFLENAANLGALTFDDPLVPILGVATFSPTEGRTEDTRVRTRLNDSFPQFNTVRGGTLSFSTYLHGHNTAPVGALTESIVYQLLKEGLGGGDATAVGTTAGGSASETDVDPAGGTLVDGSAVLVNGEYGVCSGASGSLLTALSAAPSASDVIHAALAIYPTQGINYRRFLVGHTDTGNQYALLGCALQSVTFNLPTAGMPTVDQTWIVGWWDKLGVSIPSGKSDATADTAPLAGGSVFMQTVGNSVRQTIEPYTYSLGVDLGVQPVMGPGAPVPTCDKRGMVRTGATPTFSATVPFTTAFDSLWLSDGSQTTYQHILATCNPVPGRAVGFYMPRAYPIGERPIVSENAEQTAITLNFRGREGTNEANDLTRSGFRLFMS